MTADRYRLVVARGCPWANRTMIVRRLLGLDSPRCPWGSAAGARLAELDVRPRPRTSAIRRRACTGCEVDEIAVLDYYLTAAALAIHDIPSRGVVTADFRQITLDLEAEWSAYHRGGAPDLYPDKLRDEIEEVAALVYEDINDGVYRTGFASAQEAYEAAYNRLFARLDWLSDRLATRRYLVGDTITEADIRLWPTLARFDAVYHGHFKCNRNKLTEMPVLWAYARDLFQTPGFWATIHSAYEQHYYGVHVITRALFCPSFNNHVFQRTLCHSHLYVTQGSRRDRLPRTLSPRWDIALSSKSLSHVIAPFSRTSVSVTRVRFPQAVGFPESNICNPLSPAQHVELCYQSS